MSGIEGVGYGAGGSMLDSGGAHSLGRKAGSFARQSEGRNVDRITELQTAESQRVIRSSKTGEEGFDVMGRAPAEIQDARNRAAKVYKDAGNFNAAA
jgi:hypothetical protein